MNLEIRTRSFDAVKAAILAGVLAMGLEFAANGAPGPHPDPEFADVFRAGQEGFPSIRIPSVVVTRSGAVLAIAEGRVRHADQASNKLILKRSEDGGRHWGALSVIAADGANCLNNPCTLVERASGAVLILCQSYPAGYSERDARLQAGLTGPGIVRNLLIRSVDEGRTWAAPVDVTTSTRGATGVLTMASGPGIGIQLTRGSHRGRVLMPFNQGWYGHWDVMAALSDDGGATWRLGAAPANCRKPDGKGGEISVVNEVQMVELADGGVMLNSRAWGGNTVRMVATSGDGGETWSPVQPAPALRDPSCMGSILRYSWPEAGGKSRILYSGPDSLKRENGTVYASFDEGKTWPVKRVLFPGSFAYSGLTVLPDGMIGCLFETDATDRLVFARFTIDWLEAPVR